MLTELDQSYYQQGVRDAAAGGYPRTEHYLYRLGFTEKLNNNTRGNILAGAVPDVTWAAFSVPLLERDAVGYALGWNLQPQDPADFDGFWYRQGKAERLDGFPQRPLKKEQLPGLFPDQSKIPTGTRRSEPTGPAPGGPPAGPPPAPVPAPPVPAPRVPGPPGAAFPPYRTPYLCLELLVTLGGKRAYYDEVINRDRLLAGVPLLQALLEAVQPPAFRWLGDQPGESDQGFQLSGPTGPIAWAVSEWIAAGFIGSPNLYGLPAWVGTKTRGRGFQMLGRAEIDALGADVYTSLLQVTRRADPGAWDRYRGPIYRADGYLFLPVLTPDGLIVAPHKRIDRF